MSYDLNIVACMNCPHGKDCPKHQCVCDFDGKGIGIRDHAHAGDCAKGLHFPVTEEDRRPATKSGRAAISNDRLTAALWLELHAYAASLRAIDEAIVLSWMRRWGWRIPCGACKQHWFGWLKDNPPDLSSPSAFFAWTVKAHNAVNAKLGYPIWTLDQATEKYYGEAHWIQREVASPV